MTNQIAPLTAFRDIDKLGLLKDVPTLNFHPYLPHYEVTVGDTKSVHVLARQPIDTDRRHPFTTAGNTEFNCLLWMPPISRVPATSCLWTQRILRPCSAARTVWRTSGGTWR